jgi:tRNA pseudouridine38-40 synthase
MAERTVKLVLEYDGSAFSGWQRQPSARTVQSVLEDSLARICGAPVKAVAAGRTDAGVHARGQVAGVRVPRKWETPALRRSLNAVLPRDVHVVAAAAMHPEFHARFSATSRRYAYHVGLGAGAASPFRRPYVYPWNRPLDLRLLADAAALITGPHRFLAFAVRGTAPPTDSHHCTVLAAGWREEAGTAVFEIEANRFLHHMVRFLVGTMLDVGSGRRPLEDVVSLLAADDNSEVSPPAPPNALFLEAVRYPAHLYL